MENQPGVNPRRTRIGDFIGSGGAVEHLGGLVGIAADDDVPPDHVRIDTLRHQNSEGGAFPTHDDPVGVFRMTLLPASSSRIASSWAG